MTILFPHNASRYYQLAQEALHLGKKEQAFDLLTASYQLEKNFKTNFILVSLAVELNQTKEALNFMEEYETYYRNQESYFPIYLHCLLEEDEFIKAHQIVNEEIFKGNEKSFPKLLKYKKIVRQKELLASFQQQESPCEVFIKKIKEGKFQKEETYYELKALSQEDFWHCCEVLFLDEEVAYVVKTFLLEELLRLNYKKEIEILYLNQTPEVVYLNDLTVLSETDLYENLLAFIYREVLTEDPLQVVNLIEEFRMVYASLYPFERRFIQNIPLWAKAFVRRYLKKEEGESSLQGKKEFLAIQQLQEDILKKQHQFAKL